MTALSKFDKSESSMNATLLQKLFTFPNLVHAVAGAAGSVFAMFVFYPLDTARTRLQVDDKRKAKHSPLVMAEIAKEEGLLSLYRGLFPVLVTLCCSNFVYFYAYNGLKTTYLSDMDKETPIKDLTFAFIAGVINVLVTTPLWVVNTRLKLQGANFHTDEHKEAKVPRYRGLIDALLKVARHEGIPSLWNGTLPSIVLASNPSVQFMVYEAVKRYFQSLLKTKELSGFLYFIIGAIAKTVATVVTYPLQVVQSRLRAGRHKKSEQQGIIQNLVDIVKYNGVSALYKGMEAKLIQTVFTAALMFLTYEKIAAFIFRTMGHSPS